MNKLIVLPSMDGEGHSLYAIVNVEEAQLHPLVCQINRIIEAVNDEDREEATDDWVEDSVEGELCARLKKIGVEVLDSESVRKTQAWDD